MKKFKIEYMIDELPFETMTAVCEKFDLNVAENKKHWLLRTNLKSCHSDCHSSGFDQWIVINKILSINPVEDEDEKKKGKEDLDGLVIEVLRDVKKWCVARRNLAKEYEDKVEEIDRKFEDDI